MPEEELIRVAVIMPVAMLRAGLRAVLSDMPGIVVSAEAPVIGRLLPGLEIDVFILGGDEETLEEFAHFSVEAGSAAAVLVLSDEAELIRLISQWPLPGWGVLPVASTPRELASGIRAVHAGLFVGKPWHLQKVLLDENAPVGESAQLPDEPLTDREHEILGLLARGLANKQIAAELGISENTVKFHVSSIYGKFGVTNRTEAVRFGFQAGLIAL